MNNRITFGTGLSLSEQYYKEEWLPRAREAFPELCTRMAAGLVGEGSECFGFDDEISRDHDFGPGFCVWLSEADYAAFGGPLEALYQRLPGAFGGFPARKEEPHAGKRVGIHSIRGFYSYFLGEAVYDRLLSGDRAALSRVPEDRLATCTNGIVFEDGSGAFTAVREQILAYYPEDIRIAKIAGEVFRMAQAGQYNYARAMRHGEWAAAEFAIYAFSESALHLQFLLNRKYEPYYKWSHRAARELPLLRGVPVLLESLLELGPQKEAWRFVDDPYVNRKDRKVQVIEEICALCLRELRAQGLTALDDAFLEPHAEEIYARIGKNFP